MNRHFRIAAAVLLLFVVAVPMFAARGSADFSRFVTLGDSLTLGVVNVATVEHHQKFSWPAIFARQVGLNTDCNASTDSAICFQQAIVSAPGIPPELELLSLQPLSVALKAGMGSPVNTTLARPYNNLAVDGAELADAFGVSGDGNESFSGPIVLRGLGTPVQLALAQHPTFLGIWYGADDFFGALQKADPSTITSQTSFATDYARLLDTLMAGAPNAGMVVGNLPADIRRFPFVNVLPTILIDPTTNQPVRDPSGNLIPLVADLGGGNYGQLPAGSAVIFTASSLLRTGYGIPAALKPMLPHLPDVGKPLPASAVLTPDEIAAFNTAISGFNATITAAASARNIPVADINAFFNRAAAGIVLGPISVNLGYITGGLISLDAAHPTDLGYLLIANEFIKTVNAAYGTDIPLASITQLFANNGAFVFGQSVVSGLKPVAHEPGISDEVFDAIAGRTAKPAIEKQLETEQP